MNQIPYAFYERLCDILDDSDISVARHLSGYCGKLSQIAHDNRATYFSTVKAGVERKGRLFTCSGRKIKIPAEIDTVPKKFVRSVNIQWKDGEEENVSRAVVQRFPYAFYHFFLYSSSISKAWADFACSLDRLESVTVTKKLDDEAIPLFQKNLQIHKSDDGPWRSTVVSDLLKFWSEDSAKLRGKSLVLEGNCVGGVDQLEEFLLQRASTQGRNVSRIQDVLESISRDESNQTDKNDHEGALPRFYKFEEGEGMDLPRMFIACGDKDLRQMREATMIAICLY
uniref:F-box domain-containing protein n=1 Tax=Steinernema glaseri TaxID=37863 RepID=A0A1I7YD48_9BILA